MPNKISRQKMLSENKNRWEYGCSLSVQIWNLSTMFDMSFLELIVIAVVRLACSWHRSDFQALIRTGSSILVE
jgi:hypothetical protein